MFDSLRLHGLYPIRFLCSWNSPGKNTGVGHWGEKRPGAAGRRALSGGAYVFGELLCLRRPLLLRFTSFATTMAEYSYVKSTKLVLKGTKAKSKKKKSKEKKRKREEDEETQLDIVGIWWTVTNFGEISGTIAIEMDKGTYIHALDNGLFTLGAPHKEGLCLVEAMGWKRPLEVNILRRSFT